MKALFSSEAGLPRSRVAAGVVVGTTMLNGVFLSANGIFMLIAPLAWYEMVPGVTDTGFFNQHFVRDIGMIQLFLGVAFALGLLLPERRIGLWTVATSWLCAHALFHFCEVAVGICAPSVIPRDFPAVTLPALLGLGLTAWAVRHCRGTSEKPSNAACPAICPKSARQRV